MVGCSHYELDSERLLPILVLLVVLPDVALVSFGFLVCSGNSLIGLYLNLFGVPIFAGAAAGGRKACAAGGG